LTDEKPACGLGSFGEGPEYPRYALVVGLAFPHLLIWLENATGPADPIGTNIV